MGLLKDGAAVSAWVWCCWLLASLVYAAVIAVASRRLMWQNRDLPGADRAFLRTEVIVVARDEESNLPVLAASLRGQRLGGRSVSLCLVDDASTDGTPVLGRSEMEGVGWPFRFLRIGPGSKEDWVGKKAGLARALATSEADVIVTTDADCWSGTKWLTTLLDPLERDRSTVAAIGPVVFTPARSLWQKVLALELLGLQAGAWLASALGFPLGASGANLAFRRVRGLRLPDLHPELASGDDFFLMKTLARHGKIRVLLEPQALVFTPVPSSLREFLAQRVRWASKLFAQGRSSDAAVLAAVYVFHLALLGGAALAATTGGWGWCVSSVLVKGTTDAVVMWLLLGKLGLRWLLLVLPFSELLQLLEIVLSPCAAFFGFEWKGRRYGRRGRVRPLDEQN